MKFWIQSFLLGVPKIIVGFRTRDGILVNVQEIETRNIPQTVNARPGARWNADMCVNFAGEFLQCTFLSRSLGVVNLHVLATCHAVIFLLPSFFLVLLSLPLSLSLFPYPLSFNFLLSSCSLYPNIVMTGLRSVINDEGVWRIRRRAASDAIEVFKVQETGHGDILSDEFKNWRIKLALGPDPAEAATS